MIKTWGIIVLLCLSSIALGDAVDPERIQTALEASQLSHGRQLVGTEPKNLSARARSRRAVPR